MHLIKEKVFIFIFLGFAFHSYSQESYTISGFIRDLKDGEEIINSQISLSGKEKYNTTTNSHGFFSITLPQGNYTMIVYNTGYDIYIENIILDSSFQKDIYITPVTSSSIKDLETIVVSTEDRNKNIESTEMGTIDLKIQDITKMPVLLGETDILKTIQLLPGIQSAGEGSTGFFVRGSNVDQNLILLDEANVYNASHLFGFFSTFNSDAIKDVKVIKGNFPAQYGGRLASVLDINMKEGNTREYKAIGGLGLISSRLSVEGPIIKDKSSFIMSGRRTYIDVFTLLNDEYKGYSLYFYDLNAKVNYKINKKNRIYLSGYFGRDVLQVGSEFGFDWGNYTGTLRWKSILNSKLFSNTLFMVTQYDYKIDFTDVTDAFTFGIKSDVLDYTLQQEFEYFQSPNQTWKLGFNATYHTITPTRINGEIDSVSYNLIRQQYFGLENAAYISSNTKIGDYIELEYGLRVNSYSIIGDRTYYIYDNKANLTDSVKLGKGEIGRTYFNLEPRFSVNYKPFTQASFKFAYNRNIQNLHLLSNSTTSYPTDQWVGSTYNLKPSVADQIAFGYFQNLMNNAFEISIETYYKYIQNEVDYKDGSNLFMPDDLESQLLLGTGRSYGIEFYIKKNGGRFGGWVSYTLSKTERKIDGINNFNWYNARQDRPHYLTLVASYKINNKWDVSTNFVYYSGNATTFPSGKFTINDEVIYYYTERNGYRMPDYHRLDLSANYEGIWFKKYKYILNFSLYNVYGRENAYIIRFIPDPENSNKTVAEQTSLFRWIPGITLNFEF